MLIRESKLKMDIEQLPNEFELKEKELFKKENDDKEKRQANKEEHEEDLKIFCVRTQNWILLVRICSHLKNKFNL